MASAHPFPPACFGWFGRSVSARPEGTASTSAPSSLPAFGRDHIQPKHYLPAVARPSALGTRLRSLCSPAIGQPSALASRLVCRPAGPSQPGRRRMIDCYSCPMAGARSARASYRKSIFYNSFSFRPTGRGLRPGFVVAGPKAGPPITKPGHLPVGRRLMLVGSRGNGRHPADTKRFHVTGPKLGGGRAGIEAGLTSRPSQN